jgi:DNA-binding protein H-NS
MHFDTGTLAIVLAILSMGVAVTCLAALAKMRRALAEQQQEASRQLSEQLSELNAKLSALAEHAEVVSAPQIVTSITASAEPVSVHPATEEQDELLAAVTAAAAAFVERKARINSIRELHAEPESGSAWSQQGRVFVQSSHNISPRR